MISRKHEHITPHRMWANLHFDGELSQTDHDHILKCEPCLRLFHVCLTSDSFASALKELGEDFEERRSA